MLGAANVSDFTTAAALLEDELALDEALGATDELDVFGAGTTVGGGTLEVCDSVAEGIGSAAPFDCVAFGDH